MRDGQPVDTGPAAEEDVRIRHQALRRLFMLRRGLIFLNHGSYGACPRPVFEEYQRWQLELERQPVEFLGRRSAALMRGARQELAAYVGAETDDLVFVPNATTAVNIVARSLPLQPGDEVLASDLEYGAMDRTWRFVCEHRGARYINQLIPLPATSKEQIIESIWSGVNPHTRVIFLSHITSVTALIMPVAEIVQRARRAGIWTVLDGAHGPGQVPLRLAELGVDFYAGNCHKWLCAPKGAAFLYARPEVQHLLEPLVVSWGWHSDTPGPSRFIDEHEWQGTRDIAAYLAVPSAVAFQTEHHWPQVQQECHELAALARRSIGSLTGLSPLSPDSTEWYGQMVSIPLPVCDADALKRRLYDEHALEAPVFTWQDRQLLRVSVQGYNTRDDVEALVSAIAAVIAQKPL